VGGSLLAQASPTHVALVPKLTALPAGTALTDACPSCFVPGLSFCSGQVIQEDDPHHYFLGDNGTLTVRRSRPPFPSRASAPLPASAHHPRFSPPLTPPPPLTTPNLGRAWSAGQVGVLPVAFFCSGHVFFTQRMHETLGIQPYAVHATFQFSGTPGKRHRFRDAGLWLEDDSYFHPPGGRARALLRACWGRTRLDATDGRGLPPYPRPTLSPPPHPSPHPTPPHRTAPTQAAS
jgi:hypothetical protein